MLERFKQLVADYYNERVEKTDGKAISADDVYVVWSCKTLQNWKALLSTDVPDGMYYELTHELNEGQKSDLRSTSFQLGKHTYLKE